jgi:hypothetical protein
MPALLVPGRPSGERELGPARGPGRPPRPMNSRSHEQSASVRSTRHAFLDMRRLG